MFGFYSGLLQPPPTPTSWLCCLLGVTTSCWGEGEESKEQRRGCFDTSKEDSWVPVDAALEVELETDVVVFKSGILPLLSLVAVEVILTSSVVLLFAK